MSVSEITGLTDEQRAKMSQEFFSLRKPSSIMTDERHPEQTKIDYEENNLENDAQRLTYALENYEQSVDQYKRVNKQVQTQLKRTLFELDETKAQLVTMTQKWSDLSTAYKENALRLNMIESSMPTTPKGDTSA